ncbi:glycoside hydrolase family 88/105 protein [Ohtaekwangia koreensis]|uniref:Rhamnogalacturonyl hydrolase YesR n=1 Tax=Ohtaekwangia koreensis TaxID=688867 RepID=A0A1T5MHA0_9BACT|nr:glycoside hydrolase family 88 protein [Ohtaekwangia koreensis]SKC87600.1 Rhamnogalacturonyl hydrolase YesR [Ohtaekwangia koreensis]
MMKVKILLLAFTSCLMYSCIAQQKPWGVRMAETMIKTYPDSIVVKRAGEVVANRPTRWDYEQGVLLKSFDVLSQHTGDKKYFTYAKKIMDHFVQADGSIRTYDLLEYNIDHITPGRVVLALYSETKEEKYKKAADLLHEQLNWQPRTKEGGFWHKHRYPYQMWLDGLYMGEPFSAEYAMITNNTKGFDDVINQFVWMEKHVRDSKTGLLYHAWDESKKQRWADPETGRAPGFWARGMGWYAMALVDVLDYIPKDHPRRKELVAILQRLAAALKNYQDPASGVWYQVVDKATTKGNYLEASASAMFVYALAKGSRLGYIDKSYSALAKKGFEGMLKNFIETDADGTVHLVKTVSVGGLGGIPYRDGSFEYYISEPLRTDDLKGVGPFIQASIEIELMTKK